MFGKLMPREGKYFDYFNAHASLIAQGGTALSGLINALVDTPEKADALANEIDSIEQQADQITHEVMAQLHVSFITPFDRDEIHQLINGMDNILDIIQDVAECMALYDIHSIPAEAKRMAEVTEQSCVCIQDAVKLLHNMDNGKQILEICHRIVHLEGDADRLLREAMSRVFREEPDVRQLLKLKEIYQQIESVTDRCKEVAGTIETIVLENS